MADPEIRLIRAPNASAMTGTGTNTWAVADAAEVVLIDPGPDLPAHRAAILAALHPGERVVAVLVTHAHRDHTALAPALAAEVGAPVLAYGAAFDGQSPRMAALAAQGLSGGEGADLTFRPDAMLTDGAQVPVGRYLLEALHTPGHMPGHLCFACGDILFSGDHAMGWSTSIVAPPEGDMGAYMTSLRRLAGRHWSRLLPGHGEEVMAANARLEELIAHRIRREAQILTALTHGPADATTLAQAIYTDIPAALLPAAARNVLAHLLDLQDRMRILPASFPSLKTPFSLC